MSKFTCTNNVIARPAFLAIGLAICFFLQSTDAYSADAKANYDASCGLCHNAGLRNSAKLGDESTFEKVRNSGPDAVYSYVKNKLGTVPGSPDWSDDEVKEVVDYMVESSGGW